MMSTPCMSLIYQVESSQLHGWKASVCLHNIFWWGTMTMTGSAGTCNCNKIPIQSSAFVQGICTHTQKCGTKAMLGVLQQSYIKSKIKNGKKKKGKDVFQYLEEKLLWKEFRSMEKRFQNRRMCVISLCCISSCNEITDEGYTTISFYAGSCLQIIL